MTDLLRSIACRTIIGPTVIYRAAVMPEHPLHGLYSDMDDRSPRVERFALHTLRGNNEERFTVYQLGDRVGGGRR